MRLRIRNAGGLTKTAVFPRVSFPQVSFAVGEPLLDVGTHLLRSVGAVVLKVLKVVARDVSCDVEICRVCVRVCVRGVRAMLSLLGPPAGITCGPIEGRATGMSGVG